MRQFKSCNYEEKWVKSLKERNNFIFKRWNMEKWKCTVCGYVYDPEYGDPDGGVAAGTAFENIPDGWTCPVCGATKDQFEKI
jgi:rubredoxin